MIIKGPEGWNILKAEGLAIPIASINRFGKCYISSSNFWYSKIEFIWYFIKNLVCSKSIPKSSFYYILGLRLKYEIIQIGNRPKWPNCLPFFKARRTTCFNRRSIKSLPRPRQSLSTHFRKSFSTDMIGTGLVMTDSWGGIMNITTFIRISIPDVSR